MKHKLMQIVSALILPVGFIGILILLNVFPFGMMHKYEFGGLIVLVIALAITQITLKKTNRTFRDIGLQWKRKTLLKFLYGFCLGMLITILLLAILIQFSSLEINFVAHSKTLSVLFWLLAFFPLALMEEVIFRGYAFMKIKNDFGIWPAQILLALLFSWYHDFTATTFFNQLLGPGIWALIYGIAAVWSKGLGFPTGLHMAINVVLALVGQKDDRHTIWNLEYAIQTSSIAKSQTESIGITIQIIILIIGIILTEYYRRNKLKTYQKPEQALGNSAQTKR